MTRDMIPYILMIATSVFLGAISQVLLKLSARKNYSSKLYEYINPLVIGGYFILFSTTIINVFAFKYVPLSMGPIIEATSFIYVTIFGKVFFKEQVNKKKILALLLIVAGIVVFALG